MKTILRSFSVIVFLLILIIVLFNISNSITIETPFLSLKSNVGFLILLCVILSSLGTTLLRMSFFRSDKSKQKKQFEDIKLSYDVESDKVKQLEAKIKSLEEALKMTTSK